MKVLFFSPHSALWVHAFPEALIAEALQDVGHEVSYITCGGLFAAGCVAMSAHGLESDAPEKAKQRVCRTCAKCSSMLRSEFKFAGDDIGNISTPGDKTLVQEHLARITRDNYMEFAIDGVPIGRLALYEFLINHKKSALGFDDEPEWNRYRAAVENALHTFYPGRRMLDGTRPDAIVVYNALYSINRVVCALADQRGIPSYSLHAGGNLAHRLQTMIITKGNNFDLMHRAKMLWPDFRNRPLDAKSAERTTDHFLELLRGSSVFAYSAPLAATATGLRERFGIHKKQRVLCMTLSSPDERFAAETTGACSPSQNLLFPTQADWVDKLIQHARTRPDLFLVVRVHPREFPNKREGVKSAHAHRLEATLRDLPANVAVNWPADNISLYNLAQITDVFLNAWSSTGKEMAMLGLPVVVYSRELPFYPSDLNYLGETHGEYFSQIDKALVDGWRVENIRQTFRWGQLEFSHMLLDISDGYPKVAHQPRNLIQRIKGKIARTLNPFGVHLKDCRKRPKGLRAQRNIAEIFEGNLASALDLKWFENASAGEKENDVLRVEFARILDALRPSHNYSETALITKIADFVNSQSSN